MVKIKNDIWWTGYIDWGLRSFHGYSTPYGSTYNSYLILDESPVLIDTVKAYGFDEMISRVKEVIDPLKIKYIVSNHAEMDHSGSIGKLLEFCPDAEVICSPKGEEGLKKHFLESGLFDKKKWKFRVVNSGEEVNIGKKTLRFLLMPMVHWPDSMATYLVEDRVLFPNDAFGQHYAGFERFCDEVGQDIVFREAAKYYANIVMPYGGQVQKVLESLNSLELDAVCPSHGLIWRNAKDIEKLLSLYKKWANYESDRRAVIIYDTMWHSTEKVALKFFELLDRRNIPVKLINLQSSHISDVVTEVMLSKVVLIGSPILNNRILPSIGGFLTYLKGLKPKNRFGLTFGSYGWAKTGFSELENCLEESGIQLIGEGRYFQYVPAPCDLDSLKEEVLKIENTLMGEFYG